MSFDEIVSMIIKSFNRHYNNGTSGMQDKVMECATQIYVEQLRIEAVKNKPVVYDIDGQKNF